MSITQGGYGFPALHPAVYKYMATGSYLGLDLPLTDVPDAEVRVLIEQVCDGASEWRGSYIHVI